MVWVCLLLEGEVVVVVMGFGNLWVVEVEGEKFWFVEYEGSCDVVDEL